MTPFTRTARLTALLWLLAVTLVVFAAHRLLDVPHGLNATYFAGTEWRGDRASVAGVDELPSTGVVKRRRPDFAEHPFSVEWLGFIVVLRSGAYTFATVSDDGSSLYVRGRLVVENLGRHGPIEKRGTVALPAGVHPIFIRYFQDGGDCAFEARWARAGDALEPVPASALLTGRVSYGRLVGRHATGVALMLIAIAWYAVVLLAGATWAVRASGPFVPVWRGIDPALASVLALSVLLNIWGIWWALPNTRGWAPDELVPADVLDGASVLFSHGWYGKYPPLHYAVISVADTPMLLLSWLGLLDLRAPAPYMGLFLIGRLVSVVFGAGMLVVVYLCGRELYGPTGAAFAALTAALMIPFAYYGKLTNLEVPYLFWFAVSLLAYVRILKRHARSDYVLFAASAALAVCTKDQAYGLYVLTPLAILVARWRRRRSVGGPLAHVVFDRTTMLAAGVAVAIVLVADNLLFNFDGFVTHVKVLLGPASTDYQMFPGTVVGQLRMASLALLELRYIFGWPLVAIVAVAVAVGLVGPTTSPSLRWLIVPPLSYYATFIGVVLYFFDRFLLPIGLVLALFAGWWLERFVASGVPVRRLRIALVSAAFAYSVIYVAMVDYALTTDSRYAVTRWLKARAGPDQVVAARGPLEYFMLADGFASASVESVEDLAAIQPAFIVLNPDQITSLPPGHAMRTMHDALLGGRAGYRLAVRYRTPPLPWPGQHPDLGDRRRQPELSSLSMINPTLEVFERGGTIGRVATW